MPEISRFLGIVIYMYFKDHNPPHLHVTYEKYEASIEIKDLKSEGIVNVDAPVVVMNTVLIAIHYPKIVSREFVFAL